jgi:hypothetical protein
MSARLLIDGMDVDRSKLTLEGRKKLVLIRFADQRIRELTYTLALLTQAKRSYIEALAREIVKARAGVDLSRLISD